MTNQDNTDDVKTFECVITMDYKVTENQNNIKTIYRKAPSKRDVKNQLKNRLNPGKSEGAIVTVVDQKTGDLRMLHTMKIGDVHITEVEE